MAPTKKLKPPQELIDAIHESNNMTAPPEFSTGDEFGKDVPRTIRNRLVHEEPQKLSRIVYPIFKGMNKELLKHHMREVRMMQYEKARHDRYDRNHPGIGLAGRGDEAASSAVLKQGAGGHVRYGHE
ncbi:hypothetical protein Vretimale_18466 [Volvox reticuliferus]|uniref:Uncharacterized protein n=1 Tax=Volvox reticuliferus TaxID=1737510 RepID=A0A8J4GYQ3_9CHLO|nr:hypothetical protein Vretifemale_19802 [Volvox reticuliferus]GIL92250.1 hypothetical protein Vretifemale_19802 [Volvox reticuliferus]GIL92251.1 hypothetical protein Vretifemale_19802 [Volvox reticuliferus]GIL92252.1 hypothetical protein Vretifemale_19802 [Volvox reticuliferus]GIL92257.1 hypothetical protein Vretifemale_19802 [Volvox reticuliferus]